MWNKRKEEEPPARPANPPRPTAPPPVMEPKKEATPLSTTPNLPARGFEPESARGSASIGKAVKIVGQIFSKEDLYVDGDVEGTIELIEHKLTVGPNGKVQAGIKAREVVALGNIQGNVDASDKLEIRKEARLVGDIRTARITIEDGAYFKGSIDIVKPEPVRTAAPPKPQPQAAAGATAPAEVKR
jgi:cytoskeletal protein CcmA (bactofilin family)